MGTSYAATISTPSMMSNLSPFSPVFFTSLFNVYIRSAGNVKLVVKKGKRLINSTYGFEEARTFLSTNCGSRFLQS